MIRATIELLSAVGVPITPVAVLTITNDGSGTATTGNYDVILTTHGGVSVERVEGWPRQRREAWQLVHEALTALAGAE